MRPTHIMERNLVNKVYLFKCSSHLKKKKPAEQHQNWCLMNYMGTVTYSSWHIKLTITNGKAIGFQVRERTAQARALRPFFRRFIKNGLTGTSLEAQWLRIRLPMQGTWVRALVREDPTCHGATKPVRHNCWACALEPASHNYWACVPQLLKPAYLEPLLCNKRSHHNEKPKHCNEE